MKTENFTIFFIILPSVDISSGSTPSINKFLAFMRILVIKNAWKVSSALYLVVRHGRLKTMGSLDMDFNVSVGHTMLASLVTLLKRPKIIQISSASSKQESLALFRRVIKVKTEKRGSTYSLLLWEKASILV